jgi:hypothetical protein
MLAQEKYGLGSKLLASVYLMCTCSQEFYRLRI